MYIIVETSESKLILLMLYFQMLQKLFPHKPGLFYMSRSLSKEELVTQMQSTELQAGSSPRPTNLSSFKQWLYESDSISFQKPLPSGNWPGWMDRGSYFSRLGMPLMSKSTSALS